MYLRLFICVVFAVLVLDLTAFAGVEGITSPSQSETSSAFDMDEQLDALGRDELIAKVPENARELMRETDTYELSVGKLLTLSPKEFWSALWRLFTDTLKKPVRSFAAILGIIILCAMLGGLKTPESEGSLSQVFTTVSVLCVMTSVITPILDCVAETSKAVQDAALFMLTYAPVFAAALTASGSPVTGAAYNMFLFSACEIVSQIIANTLIPLMGIYLALCIAGSFAPQINIASATSSIKSIVSWSLGFLLTVFVGLLSLQTMVSQSADSVTVRATKFMIGSLVPVAGSALSEAFSAAQGCFKLLKTTLGAYGVLVSAFTFFPVLFKTMAWFMLTNMAAIAGDIMGQTRVSSMLKACSSVLGILLSIIFCFALLIIVSTTVVMVTGMGTA